jgi:putative addiction module component (TIGR02574 family)
MGTMTLDSLEAEALKLTEDDRAALARALVASLDAPADAGAVDAWDDELLRRLADIEAGVATFVDRDELRSGLLARIGRT